MSLNYATVGGPTFSSQSGAVLSDVVPVDLGCNTGNSSNTHTVPTIVQSGLARKTKKTRRGKKAGKKAGKNGKRKYKRTMNRRRKASTHKKSKRSRKHTRKHKKVNQVGRGASYENVLTPMPGMAPQGAARADSAMANTGAVEQSLL